MRAVPTLCSCVVVFAVGCAPSGDAVPAHAVDAGSPAPGVVADAGVAAAAVVDAGVDPIPVVEVLVDAGTMADPPSPPPPPPATASADPTHPAGRVVFDRLLVKPKASGEGQAALQQRIEKNLGEKVKSMRRTAGTFWLVQLQPTTPARTKLDQAKAVERLQKSGAFASVEGDQLMTIKSGLKIPTLR